MAHEDLDGDLAELARLRVAIDEARADLDVSELASLTRRQEELRSLVEAAHATDPVLEVSRLRHELAGLRELVSQPAPDLGLSVACTSANAGGGSAAGFFPHGKYNRIVNNDDSGGYRSRNSALQRISWIEARLSTLGAIPADEGTN